MRAAEGDRGREGEQPLGRPAAVGDRLAVVVEEPHRLDAAREPRADGRGPGHGRERPRRLVRGPRATAAAGGRDAAEERPEGDRPRHRRERDEEDLTARRDARPDRAAERAEEAELDPVATAWPIGVEPADRLSLAGTADSEVGRRGAGLHVDPRPDDADALRQSLALGARARLRRAGAAAERRRHERRQEEPLHGSRPKRKADAAPAPRKSSAPAAAKTAVISRSSSSRPTREPSSS